jgi:HK97 family phage major capsid protein
MALATNPIDTNRSTTGLQLNPEQTNEIWAHAIEESAVMRLAQRVNLPGSGITIPIITGDASADWVAETAEKPVSKSSFGIKQMRPYKIAVIELFSNEFRRDFAALYRELVRRLPKSIGKKFDETVFQGTAPGSNFDVLSSATSVGIGGTNTYGKLVTAFTTVAAGSDGRLNGWAISPQGEGILLNATDGNGHPMFIGSPNSDNTVGRLLGAPVERSSRVYKAGTGGAANEIGFAGDWTQARYGIVDGINLAMSEEATINDGTAQINLWQRNMFAVRVEAEMGFIVKDLGAFVKLTDATA